MTPKLLAIDSSTEQLAVALLAPGWALCHNEAGGPLASARLIPALLELLDEAGIGLAQLQAIAFGQGPGAFTGLRTACAVAQGLALAHDTPVLAIDSLLILAEDARAQALASVGAAPPLDLPLDDWWVAVDARMDEAYAARYRFDGQAWQVLSAPQLWTLPALAEAWHAEPPQQVAGSAITAFADRLPWGRAKCWATSQNRAAALLRLAQTAWAQGRSQAADQALPLYLRDKVALTSAERLARREAQASSAAAP